MTEPLFSCADLRVDRLGIPEVDGLTCASTGNHVWVLAAPPALLLAASGQTLPTRGQIRILGSRPRSALSRTEIASAFFNAALENPRTVSDYLRASAELAGVSRGEREGLVRDAITRVKLGEYAKTKLAKASGLVRRATHLAAALATGAPTLILSDPAEGLDAEAARGFSRAVALAIDDHAYVVWKGAARAGDPAVSFADEAIVIAGNAVALQGPPEEIATATRTFVLRAVGERQNELLDALRDRGVTLTAIGTSMFRITLPEDLGTHAVFEEAAEKDTAIMQLAPITAGFD